MKTLIRLSSTTFLKTVLICNFAFIIYNCEAQNVGINGSGAAAHASALLDLDDAAGGNNKGLLIPRIPLTAINAAAPVTSPALSLLVYNTATASTGTNAVSPGYYYWDGAKWVRFAYSSSGSSAFDWNTLGNAGTNASTNFLGTTDAQDLVFRTNNLEAVRVTTLGNVGIGTFVPASKLEVKNGWTSNITDNSNSGYLSYIYENTSSNVASHFIGHRARGTYSSPAQLLAGDAIVAFQGRNAITPSTWSGMTIKASENHSVSAQGTDIEFYNNANGTVVPITRMFIKNNGNIGIGTINPANKLEITQGTAGNSGLRFTNLPNASALSTNSLGDVIPATASTATNNGVYWALLGNAGTNSTSNFIGTTDAQDLVFRTNNLEAVRIGTAGNIGIGTTPATNVFVFTQKSINSNYSPAGYYFKQNDLYNNATFNSSGNINAGLNRIINNASGTMQSSASIVANENDIINHGNLNNTVNAFGGYSGIVNAGTFSVTNLAVGANNFVENQAGRTMNVPYARGGANYISNSGNFSGINTIGSLGSIYNNSNMNIASDIQGSLFSVENNSGGIMNGVAEINGSKSYISNAANLNSNTINANNSFINLLAASTTSVLYANGIRTGIENNAGAITNITESRGGIIYFNNGGNLTVKNFLAGVQTYINNTNALTAPYMRASMSAIYNQPGAAATSTQAIASLVEFQNLAGSTYNSKDINGIVNNVYNKGTLTTDYIRGGYMNNDNDAGGIINASKEFAGGQFVARNKGSITNTRYSYGGTVEFYNKGTIAGDYQRGGTIALTNDTLGSVTTYTDYTSAVIENINRGALNSPFLRGLVVNTYNTPTSNPTLQNITGIESYVEHNGPNNIPKSYGILTNVYKSGVGSVTNAYGVYIGAVQGTNKWSLYAADGNAPSYFAGRVGIGNTNPPEMLSISNGSYTGIAWQGLANKNAAEINNDGNIVSQRGSSSNFIASKPTGYSDARYFSFIVNNNEYGTISYNGIAGTNYNTTSDIRLKENIKESARGIIDIMKIGVKDYNYKADETKNTQTGFIAQELYEIYPQAVHKGGEDVKHNPWMIDYGKLTPLLVKGMQEQQQLIEKLNAQNQELIKRIEALEKK